MRECEFRSFLRQVRSQFRKLASKSEIARRRGELEPSGIAPAGKPFEKRSPLHSNAITGFFRFPVKIGDPLDAFPIVGWEELLFVGRASPEVNQFRNGAFLFAGAGTKH